MSKKSNISIRKNHDGAWVISAIVDGHLVTRRYYFYTKVEAEQLFQEELM